MKKRKRTPCCRCRECRIEAMFTALVELMTAGGEIEVCEGRWIKVVLSKA